MVSISFVVCAFVDARGNVRCRWFLVYATVCFTVMMGRGS